MFEGEQPSDLQGGSAAGDAHDDPMASLQPEKLKVAIMTHYNVRFAGLVHMHVFSISNFTLPHKI